MAGQGDTHCRSLVSSSVEDKGDDETIETENLSELWVRGQQSSVSQTRRVD